MTDSKPEYPRSYAAIYLKDFESGFQVFLETGVFAEEGKLKENPVHTRMHKERTLTRAGLREAIMRGADAILAGMDEEERNAGTPLPEDKS